jgi:hypothetical protein
MDLLTVGASPPPKSFFIRNIVRSCDQGSSPDEIERIPGRMGKVLSPQLDGLTQPCDVIHAGLKLGARAVRLLTELAERIWCSLLYQFIC